MNDSPRAVAEEKVRVVLEECNEATQALLWSMLKNSGWSTDRATLVLRKAGWLL
jgi:hypothetical protein